MVGKLQAAYFPKLFGAHGDGPLDEASVRAAFAELARSIGKPAEEVADGFIRIAVENMANAIRKISVAKGYDARSYVLNCFGGAGGQHACLVADALGMRTVLIHPLSGLLSAYGMKLAQLRAVRQSYIGTPLASAQPALARAADELRRQAQAELRAQGAAHIEALARVHIRYDGSDTSLPIALSSPEEMSSAFTADHARQFGFGFEGRTLIAESIEVEAFSAPTPPQVGEKVRTAGGDLPREQGEKTKFFSNGAWHDAPVLHSATGGVDGAASDRRRRAGLAGADDGAWHRADTRRRTFRRGGK
jgi:5-oxoprolinase (ATP-hydrolysing)